MSYTNSSLINCTVKSPNHSGQRTHKIDYITPHCVVGQLSAEEIGSCFTSTSNEASCNYGIGYDGRICLIVDEANRSWCSSSNANDQRAITIECASERNAPYAMNTRVYNSLVKLCIDICKRNGITKLLWLGSKEKTFAYSSKSNEACLTAHRWYANKSCPGDWLYNRYEQLAKDANQELAPQATQSKVKYITGTYKVTAKDGLNIRHGAGTNFSIQGALNYNDIVKIPNVQDNWGQIKPGKWICLDYCEKITSIDNKLKLVNVPLYVSSTAKNKSTTISGTYYLWSNECINGKYKITNSATNIGKVGQVTGWIDSSDLNL